MNNSRIKLLVSSAIVFAASLPVSGAALGGDLRPDDRGGAHGAMPATSSAIVPLGGRAGLRGIDPAIAAAIKAHRQQAGDVVRPDNRAGIRGVDTRSATIASAPISAGSGFDWADAGLGAAGTLAFALLAAAAAAAAIRHQNRQHEAHG